MNQQFEYLFARRIPINYDSPAACEVNFSSTAEPMIVLDPFPVRRGPTGIRFEFDGQWKLKWDTYPGALCYSVYRAVDESDPYGDYELIAECISEPEIVIDPPPGGETRTYIVTVITEDGETDIIDTPPTTLIGTCPIITGFIPEPEPIEHDYMGWESVTMSATVTGTGPFHVSFWQEGIGKRYEYDGFSAYWTFPFRKVDAGRWHLEVTSTFSGCSAVTTNPKWHFNYLLPQMKPQNITIRQTAGCYLQGYSFTMEADYGTPFPPPANWYLWSVTSGVLPPGVTINPTTGEISGIATSAGQYDFQLTATDYESDSVSEIYRIYIVGFTNGPQLDRGRTGDAYSDFVTATPSLPVPGTFSVVGGSLPPGLNLNSVTGEISGTPTTGGTYNFTVAITSSNPVTYCTQDYSIKVWTTENTLCATWHLNPPPGGPFGPVTLGTFGPGLYQVTAYNGGSPNGWGWLSCPGCNPAYDVASCGNTTGSPPSASAPTFWIAHDGTSETMWGTTIKHLNSAPPPNAADQVLAAVLAHGVLVEFEVPPAAAGVCTSGCGQKPAIYYTDPESHDYGGLGTYYELRRVGH